MDIFSLRLKWLREKKGLTQKEVADYMGVSQQYYGRFEKGIGQPNLEGLVKLHALFDESLDFLLGIENLDSEGLILFSLYMHKRYQHQLWLNSIDTFEKVITNKDLSDDQLKTRISRIINNKKSHYSEIHNYEQALEYFIDYASKIPGLTKDILRESYLDEMINRYEKLDNKRYRVLASYNLVDDEDAEKDT